MTKYLVTLKALAFSDERGNFIVREEYQSISFSCTEWCNKFMSDRKAHYEGLFGIKLVMSPRHHEALKVEHIVLVFELIGEYYGLAEGEIFKRTKQHRIAHARFFAMKICADRGLTETEIGDAIGMDHSNINNGKTGCDRLFLKNEAKRGEYELAADFALYAINGRYNEDGSGQKLKS